MWDEMTHEQTSDFIIERKMKHTQKKNKWLNKVFGFKSKRKILDFLSFRPNIILLFFFFLGL